MRRSDKYRDRLSNRPVGLFSVTFHDDVVIVTLSRVAGVTDDRKALRNVNAMIATIVVNTSYTMFSRRILKYESLRFG